MSLGSLCSLGHLRLPRPSIFSESDEEQWKLMEKITEEMIENEDALGVHPIELIH